MALTRKMLKAMGIEEDKIEQIIEAHAESTDALKEERNLLKENAEKLPQVQKELDDLKKSISDDNKESYRVKYEAIKEEFDNFKKQQTEKETKELKTTALKQLLNEIGVSEKRISSVIKVSDINAIELDENGKIKDIDKVKKDYTDEWSDFIETKKTEGAKVETPPANNGTKNVADISKIMRDDVPKEQRYAYIAENLLNK